MDHRRQERAEILVIGAGLGGLSSALLLARAGRAVRVLDRAHHAGGRARSRAQAGFTLNVGPHALFCRGPAERVLRSLGVPLAGRTPAKTGAYALYEDRLRPLPYTPASLFTSDLLSGSGKFTFLRVLASLGERKATSLRGRTVKEWLDAAAPDPAAHALLSMMVRLSCYAHAPELLGADTAVRQLAHTIKHNVMYLDGGWQSLVDNLLEQLTAAGVPVELGVGVEQVVQRDGRVSAVIAQDGRHMPAAHVVAAVDPQTLATLLPADALAERWARSSVPLRAACLDIGVHELPHPERLNVQALEQPMYFANHTAYARLAPQGAHLLSLARYLGPGEDGRGAEPALRAFLERVQPGVWDKAVVRRFLPNMVVHNDLPGAARARAEHPEIAGLHLVSDVSSARALLLDAVLDSAEAAAQRILKQSDASKERAA